MKFLICLLGLLTMASASEVTLSGLGQPLSGSFYILDNRDIFRNPHYLAELPSQFNYDARLDQHLYINKNTSHSFALALGGAFRGKAPILEGYLQASDMVTVGAFANIMDGESFDTWGVSIGTKMEAAELYAKASTFKNSTNQTKADFKIGAGYPLNEDFKLFGEYNKANESSTYGYLAGLSYSDGLKGPFADLTYSKNKSGNISDKNLIFTAGAKVSLMDKTMHYFSINKDIYLKNSHTKLNGGMDVMINKFCLGAAIQFEPFVQDKIAYKDFNTHVSVTYAF